MYRRNYNIQNIKIVFAINHHQKLKVTSVQIRQRNNRNFVYTQQKLKKM